MSRIKSVSKSVALGFRVMNYAMVKEDAEVTIGESVVFSFNDGIGDAISIDDNVVIIFNGAHAFDDVATVTDDFASVTNFVLDLSDSISMTDDFVVPSGAPPTYINGAAINSVSVG